MHFLFPWMLLATLGVSVPIAIHLLNRYRYRIVDWGAMDLLRRALVIRSRRIRVEDLLLMALRCLAILLVALALARPVLTPAGGAWLGKGSDVGAVITIDASFSMDHRPGVNSRFDRAADRAREVARTLKPGSPVTLVLLGDRPRVLLRNVGYDADRFDTVLKEAKPLPERLNLEVCLEEVQTLLEELPSPVRECYLITDAQASTWGSFSDKAHQSLHQLGAASRVFYLPVTADNSENLALTRFELKSGLLRPREAARYEIEVMNTGSRRRENVPVSLLINDGVTDTRVLEALDPGQATTLTLYARFDKVGIARLTARLGSDELTVDNARYLVADIRERTRILQVRGPAADGRRDDLDFVEAALTPRPTEALSLETVSWLDLPNKRLGDYQLVILSNVPDLPDEQLRTLFYFVRDGGGLMVFLGDSIQPALYNLRMRHKEKGSETALLPVELTEVSADSSGWPIEPVEHPLAQVLGTLREEMVQQARVYRYFKAQLSEGGRTVVKVAGRNEPLIAEKQLGRGKVVLFTCPAEPAWTNMLVEPGLYPLLLQEAVTFLGRRDHERPFRVSDTVALPLPVKADAGIQNATFQQAGGQPKTVTTTSRDGQTWAELPTVEQPGFYEVRAGQEPLFAAVNVDPRESRVQPLTEAGLTEALQGLKVRLVTDADRVEASVRESRVGRELWKQLLVAALVVLLLEGLLALWFTRRAAARQQNQESAATRAVAA